MGQILTGGGLLESRHPREMFVSPPLILEGAMRAHNILYLPALAAVLVLSVLPRTSQADWVPGGLPLQAGPGQQDSPAILSDGSGGAFLVWHDDRSGAGNFDIYAQHVTATGTLLWSAGGTLVCAAAGGQVYPSLASDGAGGIIVAWDDERNGGLDDIYAQRLDASGTRLWGPNGNVVTTAFGTQQFPVVASDGAGGAIVAWESVVSDFDIYATRLTPSGTIAPGWTAGGTPVCTEPGGQDGPVILADGNGGAFIAWDDGRDPANRAVYVQRLASGGIPASLWPAGGQRVSARDSYQVNPRIAPDGGGGVCMAWVDYPNPDFVNSSIYLQRLTAAGAVAADWPSEGIAVCQADSTQSGAEIVPDGAGGVIVAWLDNRNNPIFPYDDYDIYAQRVTAGGFTLWQINGVPISTSRATGQWRVAMVSDETGGAIVAWQDGRNGSLGNSADDLYAQHVNPAGEPLWPSDIPLCSEASFQAVPTMCGDGAGGALVAWIDFRDENTGPDVYAQHITATGGVVAVPAASPPGLSLRVQPTPSRGPVVIEFDLAESAQLQVEILDVTGRVVRVLETRRSYGPGAHYFRWDGQSFQGRPAPAGMYFVRALAGMKVNTARLVVIR